jgi:hypothetical protein
MNDGEVPRFVQASSEVVGVRDDGGVGSEDFGEGAANSVEVVRVG